MFASFVLACVRAYALDPSQQLSQYGHTAWRVQDGELTNIPEAVVHGFDGYLWIATMSGLLRFDGIRFTRWESEYGEKLAANYVTALLTTPDGSLWIGSEAGLDRLRDGRLTRISKEPGVVSRLFLGEGNKVWVVRALVPSEKSLCWVSGDTMECPAPLQGLNLEAHTCCAHGFTQSGDGSLWLGGDLGFIRYQSGTTTPVYPAALRDNRGIAGVESFIQTASGEVWVAMSVAGHEGGLQRVVNGKLQPLVTAAVDTSTIKAYSLFVDSHDALWVGTVEQGVMRIVGNKVERYNSSSGLSGNFVLQISEDREGNIWVATTRGLDRFRELAVVTYSTREGLNSDEVDSVLARSNGSVWVGTGSGLNVVREGQVFRFSDELNLRDSLITSMLEGSGGRTWVGFQQSLLLYDKGRFTPIVDARGNSPGLILSAAEDTAGSLWLQMSGQPHRLLRVEGTSVVEEFPDSRIPSGRRVTADPSGGIWIGTHTGDLVYVLDGRVQTISFAAEKPGVSNRAIEDLMVLPDRTVLAGSALGLAVVHGDTRYVLDREDGLPCDRVFAINFDKSDDLWLSLECGIVRIRKAEFAAWRATSKRPKVRWFDALEGAMPTRVPFTNESARSSDGKLWFAGLNALQVVDPARVQTGLPPPSVHIERLRVDGRDLNLRSKLVLPPLTRDIEFTYTAPRLGMPEKTTFRYRMEGHEDDWHDAGSRRQAFYNDLAPKSYRFMVIACNQDEACSQQPVSVPFDIMPTFYQTSWFKVGIVLLSLALLVGTFAWRLRQISSRIRASAEVRLRERERIARELHDTFLQSVQSLVLKFQLAMERIPVGEPARELMEQALKRADIVLVEGRDRVTGLRDSTQVHADFASAVKDVLSHAAIDKNANVRMSVEGEQRALQPGVAEETLHILAEALGNAIRHASATRIDVLIAYSRREFVVRLTDDGRGFDLEAVGDRAGERKRFGLAGMHERARSIRALLRIVSRPEGGTTVEVTVPARVAYSSAR